MEINLYSEELASLKARLKAQHADLSNCETLFRKMRTIEAPRNLINYPKEEDECHPA
jgi:hypothetical protein